MTSPGPGRGPPPGVGRLWLRRPLCLLPLPVPAVVPPAQAEAPLKHGHGEHRALSWGQATLALTAPWARPSLSVSVERAREFLLAARLSGVRAGEGAVSSLQCQASDVTVSSIREITHSGLLNIIPKVTSFDLS